MRAIDLSFDLEGLADLLDLTPFALDVWLAWLTMSLGFGIALWAIWEMRHWRSPVHRLLRRPGPDPFAHPFGDIPTVNRASGASGAVAERSPAEQGPGFSQRDLPPSHLATLRRTGQPFKSAGLASPAVAGSGGDEKASRVLPLPARPAPEQAHGGASCAVANGASKQASWSKRRAF